MNVTISHSPDKDGIYPSATAALHAVRRGEVSARTVLEACLAAIDANNSAVNAVVHLDADAARLAADRCDAEILDRHGIKPLQGLPVTVKECFDVAGMPTTWGDPDRAEAYVGTDSVVAQKLRAAGAVIIGKTNIPAYLSDWETANPVYGETRNPHDLGRSAGGSSGGAAAAVASGFSYADIGSDLGGSIRLPAHYCGVHGLKPSWGLISMRGHNAFGEFREPDIGVAGPIVRRAEDISLLLDAVSGPADPENAWHLRLPERRLNRLQSVRVAVMFDHPECPLDSAYETVLAELLERLRRQGVAVEEAARPEFDFDACSDLMNALVRAETSAGLTRAEFEKRQDIVSGARAADSEFARINAHGSTTFHRDWLLLHETRLRMADAWKRFFRQYDMFLCPVSASAAPPFRLMRDVTVRTIPVNGREMPVLAQHFWFSLASLCYLPANSAPIGRTVDDLPVGVQVIGPRYADRDVALFSAMIEDLPSRGD